MNQLTALTIVVLAILLFMYGLLMSVQPEPSQYDYQIDIYDSGSGMVRIQDIRSGKVTTVPFDSLQVWIERDNL